MHVTHLKTNFSGRLFQCVMQCNTIKGRLILNVTYLMNRPEVVCINSAKSLGSSCLLCRRCQLRNWRHPHRGNPRAYRNSRLDPRYLRNRLTQTVTCVRPLYSTYLTITVRNVFNYSIKTFITI